MQGKQKKTDRMVNLIRIVIQSDIVHTNSGKKSSIIDCLTTNFARIVMVHMEI